MALPSESVKFALISLEYCVTGIPNVKFDSVDDVSVRWLTPIYVPLIYVLRYFPSNESPSLMIFAHSTTDTLSPKITLAPVHLTYGSVYP